MLVREVKLPGRRVVVIVKEGRERDADLCMRPVRFFRMSREFRMNLEKDFELEAARENWPRICREVPMHAKDRKTGGLNVPKIA